MGQSRPLFRLFSVFFKQTIQFLQQINSYLFGNAAACVTCSFGEQSFSTNKQKYINDASKKYSFLSLFAAGVGLFQRHVKSFAKEQGSKNDGLQRRLERQSELPAAATPPGAKVENYKFGFPAKIEESAVDALVPSVPHLFIDCVVHPSLDFHLFKHVQAAKWGRKMHRIDFFSTSFKTFFGGNLHSL